MNSSEYSIDRLRFNADVDRQSSNSSSYSHTSANADALPHPTLRRRLSSRPALFTNPHSAANHDQAQAASTSATMSSSFRPLVLTLPTGIADWNAEAEDVVESAQGTHSQALRRPPRTRSALRRNRRLFTTSSTAEEGRRDTVWSAASSSREQTTQTSPSNGSRAVSPLAFDASPRVELSDHGLHSFKRSFEQATLPSFSSMDTAEGQTSSSASGSSGVFSFSSPSTSSGERSTSYSHSQQSSPSGFTSALSYHRSSEGPLDIPLPESWLRQAESQQPIGSSTSILRHSPPTPDNAGARVKRRRSRTDDSRSSNNHDASPSSSINHRGYHTGQTETHVQTHSAHAESLVMDTLDVSVNDSPELGDDWLDSTINDMDFYDMSVDEIEANSDDEHNGFDVIQDLSADLAVSEADQSESIALPQDPVDDLEIGPLPSPLESPSTSAPVSVRRGLQRQFSLGTLPLFHFEEAETEGALDGGTLEAEENEGDTGASRPSTTHAASELRFQLPRPLRRPYLQRNTTAVSPPEESPINTPEEPIEQRDAFSIYPGLRQWHSSTDRPSSTTRIATGEFVQSRPSGFYSLRSRFGDQAPRLALDFDIDDSTIYQNVRTVQPVTSPRLDMPESVENARMRSTSATTTTSSNFSSLGTSWRSEVERSRAELLSDHLETSRRIAADVQRLQVRLEASSASHDSSEASPPHLRSSIRPLRTFLAESSSTVPPSLSLSSAAGSNSREAVEHRGSRVDVGSSLWGEVEVLPFTQSEATGTASMATASSSITLQPNFTRRPGALGRSNMRGPTRSSNEAWMRSQGIDFYDSLQNGPHATRGERSTGGAAPIRSVATSHIPTVVTTATLPSFRRTTPTPVSSLPSSPSLPSVPSFTPASSLAEPNSAWPSTSQGGSRRTLSEQTAQVTLPRPNPWRPSSSRTLSAGHPGASQSNTHATGSFVPVDNLANGQRSPRPQLDAIRPLSPFFEDGDYTLHREERQRQNTLDSEVDEADTPGPAVHRLSTSINNSREPMSWLQGLQNVNSQHTGSRQARNYRPLRRRANVAPLTTVQAQVQPSTDDRTSLHSRGQRLQVTEVHQTTGRDTWTRNTRSSSDSASSRSTSIADWFRGHTNEMPPERSNASELRPSARTAADETEEASDGIAVAVRRLDDVRRLLDEVEQNMQRRRQSYEARATEQNTEARQQNRRPLRPPRDMSTAESGGWPVTRRASDLGLPVPLTTLPSIHAPPVTSVSRGGLPGQSSASSSTSARGVNRPLRPRAQQRPASNRPTLQPFEEIFAEVEAEFSQRDRTRSAGERSAGSRAFLHGLSRYRSREAEGGAAPYQPRERQATPELSTSSLETIQSELARLRQRLQRDWSPHRSGFALQDSTNTHLPDIAGLRARQSVSPLSDFDLFDFNASTTDNRDNSEGQTGDRVPLPPFLLRSLRARRQATFGHREGSDDVAGELGNYAGDLDLDMSYEGLLALSERLGEVKRRGATDEALSRGLTLFMYTKTPLEITSLQERETRCAICLEDYEEQDKCAKSTKCGHALHEECLTTWLRRNDTCPICRQTAV